MNRKLFLIGILITYTSLVYSQWSLNGSKIYYNTANVGIGTIDPQTSLSVFKSTNTLGYGTFPSIEINNPNTTGDSYSALVFRSGTASSIIGTSGAIGELFTHSFNDASGKYMWLRSLVSSYPVYIGYNQSDLSISSGNVGIGTITPVSRLEVTGKILSTGASSASGSFEATNVQNGNVYFNTNTISGNGYINLNKLDGTTSTFLNSLGSTYFNGGNVLIGKTSQTNTGYKLDVNGDIRANKVVVNTTGADYVFNSSYNLLSLKEVEEFIQQNHHLPLIASAAEMQTNGVDICDNQTKLLQKTEELTLYLINQNKQLSERTNNLTSYNPPATTSLYRRKDICGSEIAYSNIVSVNVFQHVTAGVITPSLKTITYNTDPGILSITNPTGGMCSPSYSYTWYASTDNSSWSVVATTQNYDPGVLTTPTHYYKRKVTCSSEAIYSNTIQINVNPQIFPGTIYPSSIGIQSGTSPGTLYASPATGGACGGSFTYLWYSSTDGATFSPISGATALGYAPGNLSVTKYYKRQVSCSGDILYTNTIVVSVNTNSALYNYVQVRTITKPVVIDESAAAALSATKDVQEVTQYFDGLGRPLQTVSRQQTPAGKDVVALNVYDEFNREILQYLPYVSSAANGNFRPNALPEQYNFNSAQFPDEQNFFARTDYELSSLNVVEATYAPGGAWTGSDRGTATKHWSNTTTDDVKIWVVYDVANSFGTYTMSGAYPAGNLLKTVTINENGKQVIEFKDFQGHTTLKKVQSNRQAV